MIVIRRNPHDCDKFKKIAKIIRFQRKNFYKNRNLFGSRFREHGTDLATFIR